MTIISKITQAGEFNAFGPKGSCSKTAFKAQAFINSVKARK